MLNVFHWLHQSEYPSPFKQIQSRPPKVSHMRPLVYRYCTQANKKRKGQLETGKLSVRLRVTQSQSCRAKDVLTSRLRQTRVELKLAKVKLAREPFRSVLLTCEQAPVRPTVGDIQRPFDSTVTCQVSWLLSFILIHLVSLFLLNYFTSCPRASLGVRGHDLQPNPCDVKTSSLSPRGGFVDSHPVWPSRVSQSCSV